MTNAPLPLSNELLVPGIYVDESASGALDMPALTRELARASLNQICQRELAWLIYETNTPEIRVQLKETLRGHLVMLWAKDALQGRSAAEAFFIRCEEALIAQADIDNGVLTCEVGMAPVHPSEFLIFRIRIRFVRRG